MPPALDESERAYVRHWLVRQNEEAANRLHRFSLLFNVVGFVTLPLVQFDDLRRIRLGIHVFFLVETLIWWAFLRHQRRYTRQYVVAAFVSYAVVWSWFFLERMKHDPDTIGSHTMPGIYLTLMMYLVLLCPYDGLPLQLVCALFTAIALLTVAQVPGIGALSLFVPLAIGAALLLRYAIANFKRQEAAAEYRSLLTIAPRTIVRSLGPGASLETAFRSAPRACVCLCTEWTETRARRAFGEDAAALLARLNAFYAHCDRALRELLPAGNYYTDWIAGELFVVVFATDECKEDALADLAMAVAQRLTAYDATLDVGLASGPAHIGLMGPDGCRKATAIGEPAGRARRLLAAGRPLRGMFGEDNRVIFGDDVQGRLRRPWTFAQLALGDHQKVRDVRDDYVYYLQTWDRLEKAG